MKYKKNGFWFAAGMIFMLAANLSLAQEEEPRIQKGEGSEPLAPIPLEAVGDGNGFIYEQTSVSNVYAVTFADSGGSVLVSDSFLNMIANSGMDPDTQAMTLQQYPKMVEDNFGLIMESTFPVEGETAADMPFESIESTATDGSYMTVDQDDMASPYVRIMVKDKNGRTESFSINRLFIDGLLEHEETDGDKLISSATSFPFRLPESSRPGFSYLTREQMDDMVMHLPSFQNQEIIRMPRFYREQAEEVMKEFSNRPPRVVEAVVAGAEIETDTPGGSRNRISNKSFQKPALPPVIESALNTVADAESIPEADKRKLNWPALSGWAIAALALIWAISRRKG